MTTILIVDDERVIRDGLVRSIKGAGFETRAAEGVVQARAEIARGGVDGVLLDIRLKDGSGLELLSELRGATRACR